MTASVRSPGHTRPSRVGGRLPAMHAVRGVFLALLALVLAACSGPVLANPPAARPSPAARTPAPATAIDPRPVVLPRDDGPHERLTEWWYYTGHLAAADGRSFGFEYVIFRAERGGFPVSWASHLAITDEAANRFAFGQRSEIGPQVDRSPRDVDGAPQGFALRLVGQDSAGSLGPAGSAGAASVAGAPDSPSATGAAGDSGAADPAATADATSVAGDMNAAWTMAGAGGRDTLSAALSPAEAASTAMPKGLGVELALAPLAPPALHGRDGWVDFGAAGGSYYYSRTRMGATGTLVVDGVPVAVTGTAWFDHQWGDFIAVGGGGWDWFAVNLDDGTDLTVSLVRAADGSLPLIDGTLVRPDGTSRYVGRDEISVDPMAGWTSPRTGASYPSGWRVRVSWAALDVTVMPTVLDQELDTRATTGVVYWEGSQRVTGTREGAPVTGSGYVELTGYAGGGTSSP